MSKMITSRCAGAVSAGFLVLMVLMVLSLTACASLESVARPVPPEVTLRSVTLTALDFTWADLVAEFIVENPNAVGVDMAGFTWALALEDREFLSGEQLEGLHIEAGGESVVQVPFTLTFQEALQAIQATLELRELAYAVDLVVMLDVPVLGSRQVPLRHEGTVPVPRIPRVAVRSLKLDSISLTGAELSLLVDVDNPNLFGIDLERFAYAFSVQNRTWVEGRTNSFGMIGPEGTGEIVVPITLRFLDVGRSVYQLLTGGLRLEYRLEVDAIAQPDLNLLPPVAINPVLAGSVPLSR